MNADADEEEGGETVVNVRCQHPPVWHALWRDARLPCNRMLFYDSWKRWIGEG